MNGIRAIDGTATLAPSTTTTIEFTVSASAPVQSAPPTYEFCQDIFPIVSSKCTATSCHGGMLPALGLRLDSSAAVLATALGRVSEESNTGPQASAVAPGRLFGTDMPIIDPGPPGMGSGDPANSWMLYKLLMAVPPACSSTTSEPCDASAPVLPTNTHDVAWTALSDSERTALANTIPGREMPFPVDPNAPLAGATAPLTLVELEEVSLWISQGAPIAGSCP